jgi:hypothetical protein
MNTKTQKTGEFSSMVKSLGQKPIKEPVFLSSNQAWEKLQEQGIQKKLSSGIFLRDDSKFPLIKFVLNSRMKTRCLNADCGSYNAIRFPAKNRNAFFMIACPDCRTMRPNGSVWENELQRRHTRDENKKKKQEYQASLCACGCGRVRKQKWADSKTCPARFKVLEQVKRGKGPSLEELTAQLNHIRNCLHETKQLNSNRKEV